MIAVADLEIAFAEFDNRYAHDLIKTSLRDNGGVVIRSAIAPQRCAFYRDLITKTHKILEDKCAEEGFPVDRDDCAATSGNGWGEVAYHLSIGQLPPGMFENVNTGFSIFDLISSFRFYRVMQNFFDGEFKISPSAHTRRVSPHSVDQGKSWQEPVIWHFDAQYHRPQHFSLNFWVPLDDCGIDAPGLQIIKGDHLKTQRFVQFDPDTGTFDTDRLKSINENVFEYFDRDQLFAPELRVGDIFVIHNWTLHQSLFREGMTKPRQSCELRVMQNDWTFPE